MCCGSGCHNDCVKTPAPNIWSLGPFTFRLYIVRVRKTEGPPHALHLQSADTHSAPDIDNCSLTPVWGAGILCAHYPLKCIVLCTYMSTYVHICLSCLISLSHTIAYSQWPILRQAYLRMWFYNTQLICCSQGLRTRNRIILGRWNRIRIRVK